MFFLMSLSEAWRFNTETLNINIPDGVNNYLEWLSSSSHLNEELKI